MAVSYREMKCTGCGGTSFLYHKETKIWECKYCGKEIQRQEEYDGLYTIKNIVRQAIEDVAYGRYDEAQRNMLECEKINPAYAGTLMAGMALDVFRLFYTSLEQNARKLQIGQLKRRYERFISLADGISPDEEAVYDAFADSGDAFGVMYITFDLLSASVHRDFVEHLLVLDRVSSAGLNSKLLKDAMKHEDFTRVDAILANTNCIDCRESLLLLLNTFPDGERKRVHIIEIMPKAGLTPEDRKLIDSYLKSTQDCVETKAEVYCRAAEHDCAPAVSTLLQQIVESGQMEAPLLERLVSVFASMSPRDAELYELIERILTKHTFATSKVELETLAQKGLFIRIRQNHLTAMIDRQDLSAEEKVMLLDCAVACGIDDKFHDAILSFLLRDVELSPEARLELVRWETGHAHNLPPAILTGYLQKMPDADCKPKVLEALLGMSLNKGYYRDILSDYTKENIDKESVQQEIVRILTASGFQMSPEMLLKQIRKKGSNGSELSAMLKTASGSGVSIPNQALDEYLRAVNPDHWSGDVLSQLHTSSSVVSDKALERYVLLSNDPMELKCNNALVFAEQNIKRFGTSACHVRVFGVQVECNLLQGYVLTTEDSAAAAKTITSAMKNAGARIGDPVLVNGERRKFRRFINQHKSELSAVSLELCNQLRAFNLF